jgi:hypothetical protein
MTEGIEDSSREYMPIWVSSMTHMELVSEVYANASMTDKLRTRYDIPEGCAYHQIPPTRWSRYVAMLFALLAISSLLRASILFYGYVVMFVLLAVASYFGYGTRQRGSFPLPYFSISKLQVGESGISLMSVPKIAFARYHNMTEDLNLQIAYSDIKRTELFFPGDVFRGFSKRFGIYWLRIFTHDDVFNGEFLISVGGTSFSLPGHRGMTNEIHRLLESKLEHHIY